MKDDLRLATVLIIRKDGQYLQGRQMLTGIMLWSTSPWDAWQTRCRGDAERVAFAIKGELILFNPVIGRTRKAEWRSE
jgi:hypothetical protein